ncbi:MAG: hypothetical protein CO129_05825 [Ignavibacteriales bacterium CG_4_9_14_3_um_filter_34_10]|nr:MAG: hypothetical protein CO129_05825 [Ignavibacteriales bacterium CG_4_9_14_3_um_filter_34_10]
MNCDEIKIKMHDFLDNLLTESEVSDFEASIVKCPKEFNKFEKLNKLTTKVRTLPLSFEPDKKILANITDKLMSVRFEKNPIKQSKKADEKTDSKKEKHKTDTDKIVLERDLRRSAKIKNAVISLVVLSILAICVYIVYNIIIMEKRPCVIEVNQGTYTVNLSKPQINQIVEGDLLKVNANSNLRLIIPAKGFFVLNEITTLKLLNSDNDNYKVEIQNPDFRFVSTSKETNVEINLGEHKILTGNSGFIIKSISIDTLQLDVFQGAVKIFNENKKIIVTKNYVSKLIGGNIFIPHHKKASEQIINLANTLSVSPNDANSLFLLLIQSEKKDVFTLFELFLQASPPNREMILEKIQNYYRIPIEISKTELLLHKSDALDKYWDFIFNSYSIGK